MPKSVTTATSTATMEKAHAGNPPGERPKHAMSAIELSAWQDGAMEAGRGRDPIFGRPAAWWWVSLAALLVLHLLKTGYKLRQ